MKTQTPLAVAVAAVIGLGMALSPTASAAPLAQDTSHSHDQHEQVTPAAATSHEHDAHSDAAVIPVPADHVKWEPDAPLMEGMRRMRDAMKGLHHHEMGHLNDTQVDQLATRVDEAAAYMFANCKLDAEPDVALHGVLARLMAGAEALHADPADPAPVADMSAALADYPRLFDDPGFAVTEADDDADQSDD